MARARPAHRDTADLGLPGRAQMGTSRFLQLDVLRSCARARVAPTPANARYLSVRRRIVAHSSSERLSCVMTRKASFRLRFANGGDCSLAQRPLGGRAGSLSRQKLEDSKDTQLDAVGAADSCESVIAVSDLRTQKRAKRTEEIEKAAAASPRSETFSPRFKHDLQHEYRYFCVFCSPFQLSRDADVRYLDQVTSLESPPPPRAGRVRVFAFPEAKNLRAELRWEMADIYVSTIKYSQPIRIIHTRIKVEYRQERRGTQSQGILVSANFVN